MDPPQNQSRALVLTMFFNHSSFFAFFSNIQVFFYRYESDLVLRAHRSFYRHCGLLQIVAIEKELCLIYDTWPFIQSVIVEKRIPKKGENRVLGKQVLAELRRANDFFGDFCLTTLYF